VGHPAILPWAGVHADAGPRWPQGRGCGRALPGA
jgi:hypothetical protein